MISRQQPARFVVVVRDATVALIVCWSTATSLPAAHAPRADLQSAINDVVDGRDPLLGTLSAPERTELHKLYFSDNCHPLWLDEAERPTRDAHDAIRVLRSAADDGLDAAAYFPDVLARLTPLMESRSRKTVDLARFDVTLSAAMLRYLRHLHLGRVDPRAIGFRLEAPRHQHDFPTLLRSAIGSHRVIRAVEDLRPSLAQYRALAGMLPRYRGLANVPLDLPPPIKTAIHPDEPYGATAVLYQELLALGDLGADPLAVSGCGRYEGPLVEGVKRFQLRHGLQADGVLGKNTVAALRVPISWRVRQIELALERLRWLPDLAGERMIVLNIPMFRLWAWGATATEGARLFGMDVIVGRALSTQTPVFVEEMREVIFRPYWNVPRSILRHEVLPRIERDPDYLRREDMEIVRGAGDRAEAIAWSAGTLDGLRRGVLRVRQRPGPKNALGLIKFVFPNQEDVYMHGTPAQALFTKSRRDFSHGCVRVADPVTLAEWVLQDRPEWSRDRILAATLRSQTITVKLPRTIRVILFYTTAAIVPEDGTIRFAEDIYRHDARLDRALSSPTRSRTADVCSAAEESTCIR